MLLHVRKTAYTLIELIIVILVLGIFIGIGTNRLSTLSTDKYYSESCVNTLYGPLSEWVYYAATSKLLSGDIMPDKYFIEKVGTNSGFVLKYEKNGREFIYQTGILLDIIHCQKKEKYKVFFSTDFDKIRMLPSLRSYGDQNGFEILKNDGSSLVTGAMHLKFCSPASETMCCDFWEIVFDARTAMIKKRFCKLYYPKDEAHPGKEKLCKERTTGA